VYGDELQTVIASTQRALQIETMMNKGKSKDIHLENIDVSSALLHWNS